MKIAFKKAIRHYKYVTQRFICQLISFQLVTSNIKIVWNCLVAWSMWKKGVKILSGNDDCLDLSASYFVFPHIWENQSFFTTSYREEVKQRGPLCYSTTSVQWQSSTRKKKIWIRHSKQSICLTQKKKNFFPELWSTWRSELSCQKRTSTFPSSCSMFVCLSNWFHCWWKANKGRDWQHFVTSFRRSSH